MQRIYYINYIDPTTGFLKREEFTRHKDQKERIRELQAAGIKHITQASFLRGASTPP